MHHGHSVDELKIDLGDQPADEPEREGHPRGERAPEPGREPHPAEDRHADDDRRHPAGHTEERVGEPERRALPRVEIVVHCTRTLKSQPSLAGLSSSSNFSSVRAKAAIQPITDAMINQMPRAVGRVRVLGMTGLSHREVLRACVSGVDGPRHGVGDGRDAHTGGRVR